MPLLNSNYWWRVLRNLQPHTRDFTLATNLEANVVQRLETLFAESIDFELREMGHAGGAVPPPDEGDEVWDDALMDVVDIHFN